MNASRGGRPARWWRAPPGGAKEQKWTRSFATGRSLLAKKDGQTPDFLGGPSRERKGDDGARNNEATEGPKRKRATP
eukprot:8372207-Pyramimonas_sp.AAC.1